MRKSCSYGIPTSLSLEEGDEDDELEGEGRLELKSLFSYLDTQKLNDHE